MAEQEKGPTNVHPELLADVPAEWRAPLVEFLTTGRTDAQGFDEFVDSSEPAQDAIDAAFSARLRGAALKHEQRVIEAGGEYQAGESLAAQSGLPNSDALKLESLLSDTLHRLREEQRALDGENSTGSVTGDNDQISSAHQANVLSEHYKIERSDFRFLRGTIGCDYKVSLPGNLPDGDCQILLRKPAHLNDTSVLARALSEASIDANDLITEINIFFPNGRSEEISSLERHGRGQRVLDHMVRDALSIGSRAIYVYTQKSSMQRFLLKNDFVEVDSQTCYLKLLEKPSGTLDESASGLYFPSNPDRNDWINLIDGSSIFDLYNVSFDPGDRTNGSLYICDPLDRPSGIVLDEVVTKMRDARIWSDHDASHVPEKYKEQYKRELVLKEVVTYKTQNGDFLVARYNHPKYPSHDSRWANWLHHFDSQYKRL